MTSDSEYIRRKAEERRRNREFDKKLAAKQAAEAARDAQMSDDEKAAREQSGRATSYADQDADDFLKGFMGVGLGEVRKDFERGVFDDLPDVQKAVKAVNEANQKRLLDSKKSRRKRVEKVTKQHGAALKKAGKKTKAKSGCSWWAGAFLVLTGGVGYGFYEGAAALIAAL